ncbi:hypothetical protein Godav_000977 [Gossypium davidsonii]|uniref:Uncharacterized protein n=3 Tax=Gossypium TaxID=3633 RepID=A0A7J8T1V1_GOSDV|nr:hypothetical protein [Gossypium davidsonii]MBA0667958.1 hypothetical protein [Gossypium klotzschianum]MBA0699178.1 hypothetical protein [Gossypium aridum]
MPPPGWGPPPGGPPGPPGLCGCFDFICGGICRLLSSCFYVLCCCCIFESCCGPMFGGPPGPPGPPGPRPF